MDCIWPKCCKIERAVFTGGVRFRFGNLGGEKLSCEDYWYVSPSQTLVRLWYQASSSRLGLVFVFFWATTPIVGLKQIFNLSQDMKFCPQWHCLINDRHAYHNHPICLSSGLQYGTPRISKMRFSSCPSTNCPSVILSRPRPRSTSL